MLSLKSTLLLQKNRKAPTFTNTLYLNSNNTKDTQAIKMVHAYRPRNKAQIENTNRKDPRMAGRARTWAGAYLGGRL
ncbi:MAG: hypothetical protein JSS75_14255 [Bacteroidetes bacterium]|nr:hypothetical protein [Bacteroidota bacterium]